MAFALPGAWYFVAPLSVALIVVNLAYVFSIRDTVRTLKASFDTYREGSQRVFNAMAQAGRRENEDRIDDRLTRIEALIDAALHPPEKD